LPWLRQGQHLHCPEDRVHAIRLRAHGREPWQVRSAIPVPRPAGGRDRHGPRAYGALRERWPRVTALIFDCDGVIGDTERYGHLPAFNATFREFGLPVEWSAAEYGRLLRIGGGKERMATLLTPEFVSRAGIDPDPAAQAATLAEWHARKTALYT